jgi:hypothetical protein
MAGYTGAWRSARTSRVDGSRYVDPPTVLGRPELSELHMEGAPDEDGSRPPWVAVHQGDVPDFLTDPGDTYDPVGSAEAPGLVLDVESHEDHDTGTSTAGGQSREQARKAGNAARSLDRGAIRRQVYEPVRQRDATDTRSTEAYVLDPISAGSRVATVRGKNSLPENNPDGFRVGVRIRRFTNRKIPGGGLRRHNAHPLRVNVAAPVNVSPPPAPGDATRNGSPFSSNIMSKTRTQQAPVARRSPRAWDDDVVTDGAPDPTPSFVVWGL